MSVEEYWIGKGLDLEGLWRDFEEGLDYIEKVAGSRLHLLRLTFNGHPANLPLFDLEVLFKTVKGTFQDVKYEFLTREAYDEAAPIFLYRVDRGSGVLEFLAQLDPLLKWIVALGGAAALYRKSLAADQEFDEKRLAFIRANFPHASAADVQEYLKAWTSFGRRRILQRLIGQHLGRVEVSRVAHDSAAPPDLVDMKDIVSLGQGASDAKE
jgi:hypothetical protein